MFNHLIEWCAHFDIRQVPWFIVNAPASIKKRHFTCSRQVRDVTLEVPLAHFPLGRCSWGDDAAETWIGVFSNAFDHVVLAGSIAVLSRHDRSQVRAMIGASYAVPNFFRVTVGIAAVLFAITAICSCIGREVKIRVRSALL